MALWQQGQGKGPMGPFGQGKGQPPAQAEALAKSADVARGSGSPAEEEADPNPVAHRRPPGMMPNFMVPPDDPDRWASRAQAERMP